MTDILLIEDEPHIAEAVRFLLERDGWTVEIWPEGRGVLERVRQLRPRLLVLDMMLPGMSGTEILQTLRQDAALAALPVLMLTARGLPRPAGGEEALADSWLTKPFDNARLRDEVRSLLEAAAPARQDGRPAPQEAASRDHEDG